MFLMLSLLHARCKTNHNGKINTCAIVFSSSNFEIKNILTSVIVLLNGKLNSIYYTAFYGNL